MRALILTRKFQEPSGEATYSMNIVKALLQIYDDISLLIAENPQITMSKKLLKYKLLSYGQLDIHFVGYPILSHHNIPLLSTLAKFSRTQFYTYNFGIITGNDPITAVKNLNGILLSNLVRRITLLTTSLNMFLRFRYFSPLNLRYIPAPMDILLTIRKYFSNDELKILYLGQAYYIRFPYDKILKAIWLMNRSGTAAKLIVRFSTRHLNLTLIKYMKQLIDKMKLHDLVDLKVGNLTENEKEVLFSETDILLYPAIKPVATDPPAVILEAMSRGVCVLTTRSHSLARLRSDLFCTLNNTFSAEELVHKIVFLTNKDIRRKLAEKSMNFLRDFHSLESFIEAFRNIRLCK